MTFIPINVVLSISEKKSRKSKISNFDTWSLVGQVLTETLSNRVIWSSYNILHTHKNEIVEMPKCSNRQVLRYCLCLCVPLDIFSSVY